ncbi:MAG TPA: glutamate ABC transporter substrate-binding protein [Tepidiformaceae bacterium]|nr:glutamate ABC transporter substrate-binding protein [Tepidiformaceae bacterium]HNO65721.1 glutamate ABC transporter substrate-binding protein [Tepidiformaceae bacterium]
MKKYARFLLAMIALLAMAALITACGDDDDDDTTPGGATTAATKPAEAPTFAADSTMGKIVAKGKLTVGVKFDQPGFGLKDPVTGKVDGFDVQMAKEIGHALGLKDDQIEFVEAVSANRIPFLQEDKVDLVIATMTINADRKTQIDFSRPYYLAGQSILVKKDNTTIKSVDDLNGKNVCSVQGSTSEKNVKAKAPQANLLSLTGYAACVDAMKSGRVEAVSTDDIILAGFAASDTSLKLVGGQFTQEPYGIGVKKGKTDFVQFIDALIAKELSDGTWDKIYDKYLGKVEGLPKAADARAKLPATN